MAASLDLEKKNPDDGDFTDVWQLTQMLSQPDSPAKRAWMYDNLDLSQMANYTALTVAMRHWDSGGKNFDLAKENGSGRWQIISWDLDGILSGGTDSKGDFVTPDTSSNAKLQAWILKGMPVYYFLNPRDSHLLEPAWASASLTSSLLDLFDPTEV